MTPILTVLLAILVVFVSLSISSILVLFPNWKNYKKFYKIIPTLVYSRFEILNIKAGERIWLTIRNDKYGQTLVFSDNSVKLSENSYLHRSFVGWFDPYTLYWTIKINKALNKRREELQEMENNRLK